MAYDAASESNDSEMTDASTDTCVNGTQMSGYDASSEATCDGNCFVEGSGHSTSTEGDSSDMVPEASTSGSETRDVTPYITQHSLKSYLQALWLPGFKTTQCPHYLIRGRTRRWPDYKEMAELPGTRTLQAILSLDREMLFDGTIDYFNSLGDILVEFEANAESQHLRLPDPRLVLMGPEDEEFFSNIEKESDFRYLFEQYVFRTVSEALRSIYGIHPLSALVETVKFRSDHSVNITQRPLWDVHFLLTAGDGLDFAAFSLAPWNCGIRDFDEITKAQFFDDTRLDTIPKSEDDISYKLWAAIYDACYERCHYFVITTYQCWAFGKFSEDWSVVLLTDTLLAPICDFDGGHQMVEWDGPNLPEILIYWIQAARGAAPSLSEPDVSPRALRNMRRERLRK